VWVQDNVLHYVDSEGAHKRVSLTAIDRDVTRRMNQAQNLDLRVCQHGHVGVPLLFDDAAAWEAFVESLGPSSTAP